MKYETQFEAEEKYNKRVNKEQTRLVLRFAGLFILILVALKMWLGL